jgi:hypothetical protein
MGEGVEERLWVFISDFWERVVSKTRRLAERLGRVNVGAQGGERERRGDKDGWEI